jgi:hypothetical protein
MFESNKAWQNQLYLEERKKKVQYLTSCDSLS